METTLAQLMAMPTVDARLTTAYPPGTIGVVSADLARYALFNMCLVGTKYPRGTETTWRYGADIVNSCNKLAKEFTGDWLWFLGDDHVFKPELLFQLLDRMYGPDQCDVVASYCHGRKVPYRPVAAEVIESEKRLRVMRSDEIVGLTEVGVVGSAGMLVRRRVFDAVGDPPFEAGSITRHGLGEDWKFCLNARAAGFKVYVDGDALMGHIVSAVIWPHTEAGKSGTLLDMGDGLQIFVEQTVPGIAVAA